MRPQQVRIAELANVSRATVSRALSGRGPVSPDTRERMIRIARDVGYQPHGPAKALREGRTGAIAAVLGTTRGHALDVWDREFLSGVMECCETKAIVATLIRQSDDGEFPSLFFGRSVDGALLMRTPHEGIRQWSQQRAFPCVVLNVGPVEGIDSVYPDDSSGVYTAVSHLASLGHRRIGYVNTNRATYWEGSATDPRYSVQKRHTAYLRAIAEMGLEAPAGSDQSAEFADRVADLFANDPPSALLCYNDGIALVVMALLRERGLRVPDDVSVIGIDDLRADVLGFGEARGYADTGRLTTVHVPFREMGSQGAELLLARIDNPDRPAQRLELPETLVVRQTTASRP